MPAPKLNTEEKELLTDLVFGDGLAVLLKVVEKLTADIEQDVLRIVLNGDPLEERKLIQYKCRAEGARKLQTNLDLFIKRLKAPQLKND